MAGKEESDSNALKSLQIEVRNDLHGLEEGQLSESEDVPMEKDHEFEEGEASDDEDEVEVNVIIREDTSKSSQQGFLASQSPSESVSRPFGRLPL
ncbi:hypothetical protein SK128_005409, partial [Halocaridina rubra]